MHILALTGLALATLAASLPNPQQDHSIVLRDEPAVNGTGTPPAPPPVTDSDTAKDAIGAAYDENNEFIGNLPIDACRSFHEGKKAHFQRLRKDTKCVYYTTVFNEEAERKNQAGM
jgi:hypothetical protein